MMGTFSCYGAGMSIHDTSAGGIGRYRRIALTVLASGLLTLVTSSTGRPATPPALVCYREARQALTDCENQAKDQCMVTFQSTFGGCFGTNATCAVDCQTRNTDCESGPRARQDSCSAACSAVAKKESIMCRSHKDIDSCNISVRLRSLKCKQKCARKSSVQLQRCSQEFNSCLTQCAGG
jgi:hypothetical protein